MRRPDIRFVRFTKSASVRMKNPMNDTPLTERAKMMYGGIPRIPNASNGEISKYFKPTKQPLDSILNIGAMLQRPKRWKKIPAGICEL